jgi:hypothetical protein
MRPTDHQSFLVCALAVGVAMLVGCKSSVTVSDLPIQPPPSQIASVQSEQIATNEPQDLMVWPSENAIVLDSTNLIDWSAVAVSNPTNEIMELPTLPNLFFRAIPTNLVASVQWNPDPDTNIAGYNLYVGTQSRNYNQVTYIGLDTNYFLTVWVIGATNYFAATAVSTNGQESAFSNEARFSFGQPRMNIQQLP